MMKPHNSGTTQAITVLATPTLIQGHTGQYSGQDAIHNWALANVSSVTVYWGYDNNISASSGFPLYPYEKVSEGLYNGNVYAIVATGTAEVRAKAY